MIIYVGPDQIIPLSGLLGTTVGLALMFWHRVVSGLRWVRARVLPQRH